jgi:tetratricopeptide (TPR) repeat protein
MKRLFLFSLIQLLIVTISFSQSAFSLLGKSGGQLLQDLAKKKEWRSIGKAIETASDRAYEMERIAQQNKEELTIRVNPDETKIIYPAQGYKWKDATNTRNVEVERVSEVDRESYITAIDYCSKAEEYWNNGNIDMAITYANLSIQKEENYDGYLILSFLYTSKRLHDEALECIGSALNFEMEEIKFNSLYFAKAVILESSKSYMEAIKTCDHCLTKLNFDDGIRSMLYLTRSSCKRGLNQFDAAYLDVCKSIEFNPQNVVALNTRIDLLLQSGQKNMALTYLSALVSILEVNVNNSSITPTELSHTYAQLAIQRGRIAVLTDQNYTLALMDANKAIKHNNKNSLAYMARADIKIKMGFKEGYPFYELGLAKSFK